MIIKLKSQKVVNEQFVNIVKTLGIFTENESATFTENNFSEVEMALKKYKNHFSINAMKKLGNFTFSFNFILHDNTVKKFVKLKNKKASQKTDIAIKIVIKNVDIISHFLYHNFSNSLSCSTFPTDMKYAETHVQKRMIKLTKQIIVQYVFYLI